MNGYTPKSSFVVNLALLATPNDLNVAYCRVQLYTPSLVDLVMFGPMTFVVGASAKMY